MRAVLFHGAGSISIGDIPEPRPEPHEVVIKPYFAQVCITDVLNYAQWPPRWDDLPNGRPRQCHGRWPGVLTDGMVPGHEGGGEVVEVGSEVTELRIGDRVIIDATYRCGQCPECQSHLERDCRVYATLGNQPDWIHPLYIGINSGSPERFGRGLMAEYCAVPEAMCYRCPDSVGPLATVAGEIGGPELASVRCSGLQLGDNVVQIGGEYYGSYRMQLSRVAGADRVIYVEPNRVRREWAQRHDLADLIIDPTEVDPIDAVRTEFPIGADVVFASNTVEGSWAMASGAVRRCGTVVPFGSDPRLPNVQLEGFDSTTLTANGVRWLGDWPPIACGDVLKGGRSRNDHQIFINLMSQGRIDGTQPVTMVVSLWDEVEVISRAFTDAWTSEVRTAVRIWG